MENIKKVIEDIKENTLQTNNLKAEENLSKLARNSEEIKRK